jgi:hypothetical protein
LNGEICAQKLQENAKFANGVDEEDGHEGGGKGELLRKQGMAKDALEQSTPLQKAKNGAGTKNQR